MTDNSAVHVMFFVIPSLINVWKVFEMDCPYDEFCPSVQKVVTNRVCKHCRGYFASPAAVTRHRKGCLPLLGIPVPKPLVLINEEDDDVDARTGEKDVDNDVMPVITIEDILNSPFVKTDWMTNMKEMNN